MLVNHRVYMLLPNQIPMFWEAIKFACASADEVNPRDYTSYFNELLHALLSSRAQCFAVLTDEKILRNIAVTRINVDKITGKKELLLQCLYFAESLDESDITKYFGFIVEFAKSESCTAITFNTRNSRIWQIANLLGCDLKYKVFTYCIGGK